MSSISCDELANFLDEYLAAKAFRDAAVNGIQVCGKPVVERVALGVSAHLALFHEAAQWRADAIIVHHGLLWRSEPRSIDAVLKRRLKALFDNDISLLAYHLPLDAHGGIGNNVLIMRRLGLELVAGGFAIFDGVPLGVIGRPSSPISLSALVASVNVLFGGNALVFPFGPQQIERVGILAGGGANEVIAAAEQHCDVYITGEAREPTPALARELGINFIAAGHYNTEKLGVIALGELIEQRFGIATRFIDVPNSL